MKKKNRWTKLILAALLAAFFTPTSLFAETKKPDQKILENAKNFLWTEKPLLAFADAPFLNLKKDKFASGSVWEDLLLDFLYPRSDRTKYVQFVPHFGKNKMYWRKLHWENYETDHVSLFAYDKELKNLFISLVEETYSDLADVFKTQSFDEKLRIYIYRDRRDFSQMNFAGIDTDGILGVTHDLRKWRNKIAFLFEGSKSELFEVARHEMVHRFNMEQIYFQSGNDMLANPPLWFVEGLAVSYSVGWSAVFEWVARDAYYNDYLEYGIMPEGEGTFLPYVTGAMLVNYIREKHGAETINAIIKNSAKLAKKKTTQRDEFDEILKKYIKLDSWQLYEKTLTEFKKHLVKDADDIDVKSPKIAKGIALDAYDNFVLRLEGKLLETKLYLSVTKNGKIVKNKQIAADEKIGTEQLKNAGALSASQIAYVTWDSAKGNDVLKIARYKIKNEKIKLGKTRKYNFPEIIFISDPVFIGENKIAFIGLENGFTNIYLFDAATRKLKQLTNGISYIYGMDYSAGRNEIIFSRESDKRISKPPLAAETPAEGLGAANPNKCDFNYDLFLLNLKTRKETKVAETPFDETSPKWLDANRAVFTTDESGTFNLAIYDFAAQRFVSLGNARIAASKPVAMDKNTILFHSTEYLERQTLLLELPSIPEDAQNNDEIAKSPNNAEIGNVAVHDGKLFVKKESASYPAGRYALADDNLYFDAETAPGKITLIEFHKATPKKNDSEISEEDRLFIEKLRNKYAIMWEGISPDNKWLALVVNNRLRWTAMENSKKYPLSIRIYNLENGAKNIAGYKYRYDLAMKSTAGFYSAEFVGNYLLIILDEKILLHNLKTGNVDIKKTGTLKISPNKKLIAWAEEERQPHGPLIFTYNYAAKGKKTIRAIDTENGKETKIGEYKEIDNLHFNAENELVWSRESGWKWKNLTKHIYVWNKTLKEPLEIKINISKKSALSVAKKLVVNFEASSETGAILLIKDKESGKRELYLAKLSEKTAGKQSPRETSAEISVLPAGKMFVMAIEALYKNHLFIKVLKNQKIRYFVYNVSDGKLIERIKPLAAAANGPHLVIGSKNSVTVYNADSGAGKIFPNTAGFELEKNSLLYSQWTGNDYDIFEMNLVSGAPLNLTQTPHRDETKPRRQNETIKYSVKPIYKGESLNYTSLPPPPKYEEGRVKQKKISKLPFDVNTGFGLGSLGYGGAGLYLTAFLNWNFYDVFEDGILNLYYLGNFTDGFNIADISYTHRPSGNGIRLFFSQFGKDYFTGCDYFHAFRLSKYQRITLGGGYKFQLLFNSFPPDYRGFGSVLHASASYSLDTTRHLLHGPQGGFRLFISTDLGYNIDENDLNNIDFNFAWRQYFNVYNMLSFAYRLEAGASIGIAPTWFGMGGNMTLRGLPFSSLWGNTYALAGTEVRFDVIYLAGIILKEPLTPASSLTLAFMPQFGWYVDVGTAFYWNPLVNSPYHRNVPTETVRYVFEEMYYPPELYWSTGPFVNLPYLPLGMILRFNWAVAGTYKGWNFWLGFNW